MDGLGIVPESVPLLCVLILALTAFPTTQGAAEQRLLFEELFEDENWDAHGWYDGPHMETTADEHIPGSTRSCVWAWEETGAISPHGGGARVLTENRSVAGCNGDSDGHGSGDCYQAGNAHRNGKFWEAEGIYFGEDPGPRYKGDWHHVQAKLWLNTVRNGVGQKDGVLQYWFDGELIIDHRDVIFRTGRHPDMLIVYRTIIYKGSNTFPVL